MSRFVERDGAGRIKGSYASRQPGYAEEELADNDAELVSFQANGVALTAAEIDAAKTAIVDQLQTGATKALATLVFQIMKGTVAIPQPALTPAQFKALLKSLA